MATTKQTFTYKTANGVPIQLDVHLPASPPASPLPLLLWFHGGGLLQGTRETVAPHHLRGITKHHYAFLSADYRLCPQVGVRDVLADATDCLDWVATELPAALAGAGTGTGTGVVDTSRIAVSGSSAGGYLALLAGLHSSERAKPRVVLPLYPITNPLGRFFAEPRPHPLGRLERSALAPFLDVRAPVVTGAAMNGPRGKFYFYMLQEAILAELLHVDKGDDEFVVAAQIRKRGAYLPTFIVHGDADTFVGVEQADEVVDALRAVGAAVEYERREGLNHVFDMAPDVELEGYYAFLKKHL